MEKKKGNDGNNKSFKMLPGPVTSGCMPIFPGLTMTIFMTGSDLFPDDSVWMTAYKALNAHVFPSLF